ncbi:MAG: phospholipid/cholesterol/gamma-HCH transport system substrate-binding protein [Planctomycetota bacterium]|jgi:phospholipid/cholesterol/gamma-HCH transport system substrate-binding protein
MADKQTKIEITVGLFMLIGLASISYIAIKLGDLQVLGQESYILNARFTSASGLRSGAYIEAAGVRIGTVDSIVFDPEEYQAIVYMAIDKDVPVHEDAVASIRTAGIIGDKFVKITPGGGEYLQPGEEVFETEPSINLEELISKYIFETEK